MEHIFNILSPYFSVYGLFTKDLADFPAKRHQKCEHQPCVPPHYDSGEQEESDYIGGDQHVEHVIPVI